MFSKRTLHLLLTIAMIAIVCFGYSFAQTTALTATEESIQITALSLNFWISVLSRSWIIFANFAGEFLTNTRVYGSAFWLDSYLRLCRNMMKNIANFTLWFIFVFYIFRVMIYKDEATSFIKNIVIKILVAGVCIQISRFLTAAILDVSTIATAAVGTIPSHVITLNTDLTKAITHITKQIEAENGEINRQITRTIDLTETSAKKVEYSTQPINSTLSISGVIDLLTPNANSFAGPLVYLGINMLNESQLPNMDMTQPLSSLIKILFSGIEIILYSLAMILLCVIAFMRIVYLRLFIILSPIIILLYCISAVGKQKLKEIDGITDALKQKGFSVQGFLNLAFKPVIICLALSLALIFSGLMRPLIDQHSDSLESNGVTVTSKEELTNNAQGEGGKTYTTTLDTNMVNVAIRGVNKTLQELLLSIITLVLMWFIIKIAIAQKTGIWIIDKFAEKSTGIIQDFTSKLPIIPVPWGTLSMSNIYDPKGENGIFDKIERNTDNAVREFSKGSEERLNKFFGDTTSLTSQAAGELTNVAISSTQYNEFITETKKLDKGKKDVGLGDSTRTGIFKQWLNNSYAQNHYKNSPSPVGKLFNARINQKGKDEDIKTFFEKNPQAKNRYRELFSDTTNTPPDIFEKKSFN